MTTVFVTHPTDKQEQYFGAKASLALRAVAEPRFNPEARDLSTAELIEVARGCDAVIAYRQTAAPEALFHGLPDLVAFIRCAVDIRTVDVGAASACGVLVTQASPGYAPAVAELIIAVMVDLARGISCYAESYHSGQSPAPFMGRQLRGSTLGVIGHGHIGRSLTDLALAFGMEVLVTTPQPLAARAGLRQVPLPALLGGSDFVACLAPANTETANLMDARAFASMRPGSFFINASRGELVDDDALLGSLESGHLAGCALDVGRAPDQMPAPRLARHPKVLAAPHVGGLTLPAVEHQALETVAQLTQLLQGTLPPGVVNAAQATRLQRWGHAVGRAGA